MPQFPFKVMRHGGFLFYLDYLGFEMVTLENYEEIYKGLLEV